MSNEVVDNLDFPSLSDLFQVTRKLSGDLTDLTRFCDAQLCALNIRHEQEKGALEEQISTLKAQIELLEKQYSSAQRETESSKLQMHQLSVDLERYFLLSQRQSEVISAHSRLQKKCISLALDLDF